MTTLYDFQQITERCYDCYDSDFDSCVTVEYIDTRQDDYDLFIIKLTQKVEITKQINDCTVICNWTKLIKNNIEKFKIFTNKNWDFNPEDEDDFIYYWIKELNYYCAGEVPDDFYSTLCEFVDSLN